VVPKDYNFQELKSLVISNDDSSCTKSLNTTYGLNLQKLWKSAIKSGSTCAVEFRLSDVQEKQHQNFKEERLSGTEYSFTSNFWG